MTNTYGRFKYAILATDVVVFTIIDEALHVLLIKTNKAELKGKWALPGGLISGDEDLEESARKHLAVKTGIKDMYIEQLQTFGDPRRDPFGRVVSVAYVGLVPSDKFTLSTTGEYEGIEWHKISDLPKLAYDHEEIIAVGLDRLRSKLTYTNIVQGLLPKQFTLTQMQGVYELILNKKIDKRNFRKKILSLDLVKETKNVQSGGAHRPAQLYTFKSLKPIIVEML